MSSPDSLDKATFQSNAKLRLEDAQVLYENRRYDGNAAATPMSLWTDTNALIDKVGGLLPDLELQGAVNLFAFAERDDVDRRDVVLSVVLRVVVFLLGGTRSVGSARRPHRRGEPDGAGPSQRRHGNTRVNTTVLSSEWSDKDSEEAVRFVVNKLRPRVTPQEMTLISRIAVVPSSDSKVQELIERLIHIPPQDHLIVHSRLIYGELLGSGIKRAFVFKVQRSAGAMTDMELKEAATHS